MKLKRLSVALAVSAAFGTTVASQPAHADAIAQAQMVISNFLLLGAGATVLDISAFRLVNGVRQLSFLDTLTNTSGLNFAPGPLQQKQSNAFVAAVDAPMSCIGACAGIGENNYVPATAPPTKTYARADNILAGIPITGFGPPGVTAATIAETYLNTNSLGNSATDIILTSSFQFAAPKAAGDIGLSFDAGTFLRTWTAPGSAFGTSAGSDFKWEIVLKQGGTTLIDWLPDGNIATGTQQGLSVAAEGCNLNKNAAAGASEPNAPEVCGGSFLAHTSIALAANTTYTFTITQHATSQAVEVITVPEPDSLALFGLGLVGLGAFARRRYSPKS